MCSLWGTYVSTNIMEGPKRHKYVGQQMFYCSTRNRTPWELHLTYNTTDGIMSNVPSPFITSIFAWSVIHAAVSKLYHCFFLLTPHLQALVPKRDKLWIFLLLSHMWKTEMLHLSLRRLHLKGQTADSSTSGVAASILDWACLQLWNCSICLFIDWNWYDNTEHALKWATVRNPSVQFSLCFIYGIQTSIQHYYFLYQHLGQG